MTDEFELEILYEDYQIALINKPSGLLTHQSKMSSDKDTLVDRLKKRYESPPSPVHRLDRATSGVVLCAFDSNTAATLGKAFADKLVEKSYMAVVRGFTDQSGEINRPLRKDGEGELQEAHTSYERIGRAEIPVANNKYSSSRYSLVRIKPLTGRYHQIRRHLAGIGHPVIGDTSHGDLRHNRIIREFWGNNRLLLHCLSLTFPHPVSKKAITIKAPLPEEMKIITHRFQQ